MSAARASRSAATSARASTAVDACVPLMSARPSFGASRTGASPARASASAPGRRPAAVCTSPSPMSTSARWASGARSPLAPTDPRLGTTGWTRGVEHRDEQVERLEPDAGMAACQDVGAQRHHRADDGDGEEVADAGGMAAQQVDLQRVERVGRDADLGEGSEPGVDAVDRRVAGGLAIDHRARGVHARLRVLGQDDRGAFIGDRRHGGARQRGAVEQHRRGHDHRIVSPCRE